MKIPIPPSQLTVQVPKELSEKEAIERKDLAVDAFLNFFEHKERKTVLLSRINTELKEKLDEAKLLARQAKERMANVDVPAVEEYDDARKMVVTRRLDTGGVHATREMTVQEKGEAFLRLQPDLFNGKIDFSAESADGAEPGSLSPFAAADPGEAAADPGDVEDDDDDDGDEPTANGGDVPPAPEEAAPAEQIEHRGQKLTKKSRRKDEPTPPVGDA